MMAYNFILYLVLLFDIVILLSPFPQRISYLDNVFIIYLTRADYIPQFINHFILISLAIISMEILNSLPIWSGE